MQVILDSLAGLELGAPRLHRNLALFPLIESRRSSTDGTADARADYLMLDDARARKLSRVSEVAGSGGTLRLEFENRSAEKILLVDGDELPGARRNRTLNLSILVGEGSRVRIPACCVELGRWSLRPAASAPLRRALFFKSRAGVASRVQAFGAELLEAYARAFRAAPRQRGAVAAIDGKVVGLELFDSAATFARCLCKLVLGYALDAIGSVNRDSPAPSADEAGGFLSRLQAAATERYAALGEGDDLKLSGDGVAGGALTVGDRLVHLTGFAVG